jgi:hypothetical protein
MKYLSINKGSRIKKLMYGISICLTITLCLWVRIQLNDVIIGVVGIFTLLFLIPIWYFETFSYIRIMYHENTFSVLDGTKLLKDKYVFSEEDIIKIQCKGYRENTGSSKTSGPMTYNTAFDTKTGNQPNYAIKLILKNRKVYEFGKYITLNKFRKVKEFINSAKEKNVA